MKVCRWQNILLQKRNRVNFRQVGIIKFAPLNQRVELVQGVKLHALNEVGRVAQLHFNDKLTAVFVGAGQIKYSAPAVNREGFKRILIKMNLPDGRVRLD